jgi:glycosyltransferase involved in cell wall biosynthesis
LRILFAADVPRDPHSGAAGTEVQTIEALRALGHTVDEVWADDLGRRIAHGNLHYAFELPRAYRRVIRERCARTDYDVIHVNMAQCYLAAADHHAAGRPGVFVCRSHGLEDHMEEELRPYRHALGIRARQPWRELPGRALAGVLDRHMRLAARHVDGYIVSSGADRDFLIERHRMPSERVHSIPQAPAGIVSATPAPPWTPERGRELLHVAGFGYVKGPHAVTEAINQLAAAGERFRFTWVCRQSDHDRARALLTPAAAQRTMLVDWMPQDRLRGVYDGAGVFLYPPLFDGFGKVFLEAMARGLCVVGTVAGGMRDILTHEINGLIVERNSPSQIAAAVRRLWDSPALGCAMSRDAAEAARRFSWQRVAVETARFYDSLLAAC